MAEAGPDHVFVFRRDLRVHDNPGLAACLAAAATASSDVTPVFVLCAEQADPRRNPYHSAAAVRFMLRAVADLRAQTRPSHPRLKELRVLRGTDELDALSRLRPAPAAVAFNEDVTPYARKRDDALRAWCAAHGIACSWCSREYSLLENGALGRGYQVFTPFYNRCKRDVVVPAVLPAVQPAAPSGGLRGAALAILDRIRRGDFDTYAATRDDLGDADGTTRLSAHLKFGTVSVREAYHAAASRGPAGEPLVRQLFWRAFFDQLVWHFPHMMAGGALRPPVAWNRWAAGRPKRTAAQRAALLEAWKAGTTGEPLVDAGMRQLAATGYMHNRARMVTASYLVWDLGLDWREGERHFARCLQDYHPPANTGNWQWILLQTQPSRVLSARRQASKHDADGEYRRLYSPIKNKIEPLC